MSFGSGVGDIIAIAQLAYEIWGRFANAPVQFETISKDVKALSTTLEKIAGVLPKKHLTQDQEESLEKLSDECEDVLEDVKKRLGEFSRLSPKEEGKRWRRRDKLCVLWDTIRFDKADFDDFHKRLTARLSGLKIFLQAVMSDTTFEIKAGVDQLTQHAEDKEFEDLLNCISSFDHVSQHHEIFDRRQQGTGSWLLNSDHFQEWVRSSNQDLLCHGIPGAGKTILASVVIDHLRNHFHKSSKSGQDVVGVAYFYFTYQPQREQSLLKVRASLLRQLLSQHHWVEDRDFQDFVKNLRETKPQLSSSTIRDAISWLIGYLSKSYIVLDALDEYHDSDSGALNQLLNELLSASRGGGLQIFATTRPISSLMSMFKQTTVIEVRAHKNDILTYIGARLRGFTNINESQRKDVQELIEHTVLEATDGMFLLAQLHLDTLKEEPTLGDLKLTLKKLPRGTAGLNETYDIAMKRIDAQTESSRLYARKVLSWITHARKALSTRELMDALAIRPGQSDLDRDFHPTLENLDSKCAGLVTVDKETDIVRLVHYTTQKYFVVNKVFPGAHDDIAEACFTYISFEAFEAGPFREWQKQEERKQRFPLYVYAANNWAYHAALLQDIPPVFMEFVEKSSKLSACMQVDPNTTSTQWRRARNALVLAAERGRSDILTLLLGSDRIRPNEPMQKITPLMYAARLGHAEIVRQLLADPRVDPTAEDWGANFSVGNALEHAISRKQSEIVKIFLSDGRLDPNRRRKHRNPVTFAIMNEDAATMDVFLDDPRVDLNLHDYDGNPQTALDMVIKRGWATMAEKMLGCPRVDVTNGYPLIAAATRGLTQIAIRLLDINQVDINAVDPSGNTAVNKAIYSRYARFHMGLMFVRLEGINLKVRDKSNNRTPLSYAAEQGREELLKLILHKCTENVDLADHDGRTPFSYLVQSGALHIVEWFLANFEVAVHTKDKFERTPIHFAANGGNLAVLQFLVTERGLDLHAKDYLGQSALHHAANGAQRDVVALLITRYGFDPNVADRSGMTPLHHVVRAKGRFGRPHEIGYGAMRYLQELSNINAKSRCKSGKTPLDLTQQQFGPLSHSRDFWAYNCEKLLEDHLVARYNYVAKAKQEDDEELKRKGTQVVIDTIIQSRYWKQER
ncbi:ankyrin repeat-containing domain protein [Lophiotrema nucula]|uniref:Ankyrin repeat-containing domain protein n=1 Tax=Lophiotrema nucula TaxID=690887 RepID=A0A6A5ZNJ7_9PLEO|nr:ankyrin repeat-containing domain protein [Lophiotrema nucula]